MRRLRLPTPRRAAGLAAGALAWVVLAVLAGVWLFTSSSRAVDVASHQAIVAPDLSGEIVVRTGPVLPDLRVPSGTAIGADITLGKSDTSSLEELTARYAAIGSQPEGQVAAIERAVRSMAYAAAVQGAALATVPLLLWVLVGAERRRALRGRLLRPRGAVGVVVLALVVAALVVPTRWGRGEERVDRWMTLRSFLGPEIPLPDAAREVEISGDATTAGSRRLIESALSSYEQGERFYRAAQEAAGDLDLRAPADDESVAVLISDRHDNIGMDRVARAIGDAGGATTVLDAGDDTSTGERWEAFSLDSVSAAFDGYDERFAVAGNHDNGTFVRRQMQRLGWTYFDGEVRDGPGGSVLLGVDDPRSSGLGNWRDEKGLSFSEVGDRLADAACAADADGRRVATLLVHDANIGRAALRRGCVDLVVGGHVHVESGPTAVESDGSGAVDAGAVGYTYTLGTTGGAAYAIAYGTKLRRAANVALITYRAGRPVGLQSVTLQTNGRFDVTAWQPLLYGADLDGVPAGEVTPGPDGATGSPPPTEASATPR